MAQYIPKVQALILSFAYCVTDQIPMEENGRAYFLARVGSSAMGCHNRKIDLIFAGKNRAAVEVMSMRANEDWRAGIIRCLGRIKLQSKQKHATVEAKVRHFFLDKGVLFKFSFSHNTLRCSGEAEAGYVMKEVHQGCCGDHVGGRNLASAFPTRDTIGPL